MTTISFILLAAACFLAAVLNLAVETRIRNRIMSIFGSIAVVSGLILYGYGYSHVSGFSLVSLLHTIMAVCRMIGGSSDLGSIESAPLFQKQWVIVLFWVVHFMAFYAVIGSAAAAVGARLLRRIRIAFLRRGTLLMIYAVNAESVEYGKRQMDVMHRSVVFLGQGSPALEATIRAAGGVTENAGDHPDERLLRKLGIRSGKRQIEIAALHEDGAKNFSFICNLLGAFEKAAVQPRQTRLLIRKADEEQIAPLVVSDQKYGYGSILAFREYELAARLMMQKLPPCETIPFDGSAKARENFHGLIIGFGRMGRAALDALLMNGQFCGSDFRVDIIDEHPQNGMLHDHEIRKNYDIRFHEISAKSEAFYAFLKEQKDTIRYIVLCTGSEKENREIARDMGRWLKDRGAMPAIVQCSGQGLVFTRPGDTEQTYLSIYGSDALDLERIDRMAMAINHAYSRNSGKTPWENWMRCDYFSRMSSRASADFYQAILTAAGKTMQQVEAGEWPPQGEMLENLSITEHLRWCAFHYVMNFRPMSEGELDQRIDRYQWEMQEKGKSSLRLTKDMEKRIHACLIPWDDLDQLSARESAVTGKPVDYKQMDRNNILVLPDILAILHDIAE
ncbi:MAG: hypothetical protein IJD39_01525 [Clostridia bacterium]|nr:hypothetical protein [Clostridia bacterium]